MKGASTTPQDLSERTKVFAIQIIRLYTTLPKTTEAQVISKIEGGLQELEETAYWLELLADSGIVTVERLKLVQGEAEELTAIFVTIVNKVKARGKAR